MDISRLNSVMEVLRRQLAETERHSSSPGLRPGRANTPAPNATNSQRLSQLQQRVRERIKQLEPSDPQHAARSRQIFIESVLVWEFGEQFLSDQRFQDIVAYVQSAMNAQPDIERDFKAFFEQS